MRLILTRWAVVIAFLLVSGCAVTIGSPVPDERSDSSDMESY